MSEERKNRYVNQAESMKLMANIGTIMMIDRPTRLEVQEWAQKTIGRDISDSQVAGIISSLADAGFVLNVKRKPQTAAHRGRSEYLARVLKHYLHRLGEECIEPLNMMAETGGYTNAEIEEALRKLDL